MKFFDSKTDKNQKSPNWIKCLACQNAIYEGDLADNAKICPKCGQYHRMTAHERAALLIDQGTLSIIDQHIYSLDPLSFGEEYFNKLMIDVCKTGLSDAILTATCTIGGFATAIGIMDFHFRGGSMGSVVGEKLARLFETALNHKIPAVVVTTSGGARMQEGILALMQMAKTTAMINRMHSEGIPYITILTDPTTGGVSASFAMLGDIIIAESNAIIGFSGARVIEQTIRQKLPPGFQSSEYLEEHGFADQVVSRKDMRRALINILSYFQEIK